MDPIHNFPTNDIKPHMLVGEMCECEPEIAYHEGVMIICHQSFDNREVLVEAEMIMGLRCQDCGHYVDKNGKHANPPPRYIE